MGRRLTEMTLQGFLDREERQPERHELHRGEVFAIVGARRVHNEVVGNIYASLKQHLRGSPCRADVETMKLLVDRAGEHLQRVQVFGTASHHRVRIDSIDSDLATGDVFDGVESPSAESPA